MIHDIACPNALAESHCSDGCLPAGRTDLRDLGREPLESEGTDHDGLLEDPPETANGPTANQATHHDLGSIRGMQLGGAEHPSFGVEYVGTESGVSAPIRHPLRGDGVRIWKVDLCRKLNAVGGGNVICDRRLRRHTARAGECFVEGRFINVAKYVAWLFDCRHSPPPRRLRNQITGNITTEGILATLERQQFRCALTGRRLMPDDAALDHIIPLSRGGKHTPDNLQILHREVNRAKSTLTNDEFIGLCGEIVAHTKTL